MSYFVIISVIKNKSFFSEFRFSSVNQPQLGAETNQFLTLWSLVCEIFADAAVTMETTLPAGNSAAEGQSVLQTSTYRWKIYLFIHLFKKITDRHFGNK